VNNNFDVNYGLIKKGTLNLGLNYSFANNTIQNVVLTGNDGISRSTFANIGKNDVLGINLNLNYPLSPKLRINFNSRGQYLWLTGIVGSQGYNNEGFSFTTSTNFSYVIPKDWRLRLLVTSTTPVVTLQGKTNGYVATVLSLNKEFFNKKLGVILRCDNPTQQYRTSRNIFSSVGFTQQNDIYRRVRGYYINIYYSIGSLKEKIKKNKHGINNDDIDKGKIDAN